MFLFILKTILAYSSATLAAQPTFNNYMEDFTPMPIILDQMTHKTVINGDNKKMNSTKVWTHSVLLYIHKKNGKVSKCSGTIIANDTILTAAHCLRGPASWVEIIFGYYHFHSTHIFKRKSKPGGFAKFRDFVDSDFDESESLKVPRKTQDNPKPYLSYDRGKYQSFLNYFNKLFGLDIKFQFDEQYSAKDREDIGLVFFDEGLPVWFKPARWYNGHLPDFKDQVFTYGYGLSSRYIENSNTKLNRAREMVYKYYADSNGDPQFFRSFSGDVNKSTPCAGDSGAGTYFYNPRSEKFELIAIAIDTANKCANGTGHLLFQIHTDWIEQEISKFRNSKGI